MKTYNLLVNHFTVVKGHPANVIQLHKVEATDKESAVALIKTWYPFSVIIGVV